MRMACGLQNNLHNQLNLSQRPEYMIGAMSTKTEWMAMIVSARKQGFTFPALTNRAGTAKWSAGDSWN